MTRRGRRRPEFDWPRNLPHTRRRLGRTMLLLGVLILVAVLGGAYLKQSEVEKAPAQPGASSTARAPLDPAAVGSRASAVVLHRTADGWYAEAPDRLPLVQVDRIIDGDTLVIRAGGDLLHVRLYGINAPEVGKPCASEATAELTRLAGREVRLLRDARLEDRFGRELRYLFTPDGRSIDAALVDEGLAPAWREDGAYRGTLVALEDAAHAAKRGCLWKAN